MKQCSFTIFKGVIDSPIKKKIKHLKKGKGGQKYIQSNILLFPKSKLF